MTQFHQLAGDFAGEKVREEEKKAVELIRDFVQEKLEGQLNSFLEFNFFSLYGDDKYGCPERQFDCDDTELARAVYVLLWAEHFPELSFENIGTGKLYRGDTLNTFHTMFGREIPGKSGFYAGLENYDPDDALRERVRLFREKSSRLGNFTVLPNLTVDGDTLNTYRGCCWMRDFFDRFLQQLCAALSGGKCDEKIKLLVEKNNFFFEHFQGKGGFHRWAEQSLFYDYMEKYTVTKPEYALNVFKGVAEIFKMNYHWFNPADRESYLRAAQIYLDRAEKIIERRSGSILAHIALALQFSQQK